MGLIFTKTSADQAAELHNWIAELSGELVPQRRLRPELPGSDRRKPAVIEPTRGIAGVLSELVTLLRRKGLLDESEAQKPAQQTRPTEPQGQARGSVAASAECCYASGDPMKTRLSHGFGVGVSVGLVLLGPASRSTVRRSVRRLAGRRISQRLLDQSAPFPLPRSAPSQRRRRPRDHESQAQPEYSSSPPAGDLTPAEQKAWNAALDAYARDWSSRDLLHNIDMVIANDRLAELENCADFSAQAAPQCVPGLRADLVAALAEAAPVYRAHWWPQQDRENRAWMAAVTPLVHGMGSDLATQLIRVYQHPWPTGRLRVDVVWYAGPEGSYTTLSPPHITIASHDSRNQGLAAFEMLFHEASHTLADGVNEAIARHCRDLGKPIPRDLWHALLFYTTGELVRREVARSPAPLTGGDARRLGLRRLPRHLHPLRRSQRPLRSWLERLRHGARTLLATVPRRRRRLRHRHRPHRQRPLKNLNVAPCFRLSVWQMPVRPRLLPVTECAIFSRQFGVLEAFGLVRTFLPALVGLLRCANRSRGRCLCRRAVGNHWLIEID